jgi:CubicO group peptidase (beta-lactamase class C family)
MPVIDLSRNDSSTRASEGDLRNTIAARLRRWPSAGVAVAVVRNNSPVQFFCHGVADVASGRRVSEDTVFRIGSLTKTITAVAVMKLCEQVWVPRTSSTSRDQAIFVD